MMNYKSINKNESEAHRKELNVLTSYRLNDFKKKAGATHVDMSANIRRAAFTLAEVLITLAIIGVVAAMTIPTLISNYTEKATISKLKKAYATIANVYKNVYKLSMIDNGTAAVMGTTNNANAEEYVTKYFLPYFSGAKTCKTYSECGYSSNTPYLAEAGNAWTFQVADTSRRIPIMAGDGMFYWFALAQGADNEGNPLPTKVVYVDVNGAQKPNRLCADMFVFTRTENGIVPYINEDDPDDPSCVLDIIENGWKIPDDYPYSF